MDHELYAQLNRISDESINEASTDEDLRSELIDAMYTTGFAFTGEQDVDGVKTLEFKRQDVVVQLTVSKMEPKSEAGVAEAVEGDLAGQRVKVRHQGDYRIGKVTKPAVRRSPRLGRSWWWVEFDLKENPGLGSYHQRIMKPESLLRQSLVKEESKSEATPPDKV